MTLIKDYFKAADKFSLTACSPFEVIKKDKNHHYITLSDDHLEKRGCANIPSIAFEDDDGKRRTSLEWRLNLTKLSMLGAKRFCQSLGSLRG